MASSELTVPSWIVFNGQNADFSRNIKPTCLDKTLSFSLCEGHKQKGFGAVQNDGEALL